MHLRNAAVSFAAHVGHEVFKMLIEAILERVPAPPRQSLKRARPSRLEVAVQVLVPSLPDPTPKVALALHVSKRDLGMALARHVDLECRHRVLPSFDRDR